MPCEVIEYGMKAGVDPSMDRLTDRKIGKMTEYANVDVESNRSADIADILRIFKYAYIHMGVYT